MVNTAILTLLTIILFCCMIVVYTVTQHDSTDGTVYIIVTATPTPTYELFRGECPSYCPTPYPHY